MTAEHQRASDVQAGHVFGPHAAHYAALARVADILDDIEATRKATENRLRSLQQIGLGDTPEAQLLTDTVASLAALEHGVELELARTLRRGPLAGYVKSIIGVGEKQGARLLAATGDPYWNSAAARPRRGPAELWAYCGLHTLPVDQARFDAQTTAVDGTQLRADHPLVDTQRSDVGSTILPVDQSDDATHGLFVDGNQHDDPGHARPDAHKFRAWVAARRRKGQRSNWSAEAKSRACLIAAQCIRYTGEPDTNGKSTSRSPYRDVYDKRKANTDGRLHRTPCPQCGPKGHPAQPGSPWSDGHRHADALRITAKELLKHLWREARRVERGDEEASA